MSSIMKKLLNPSLVAAILLVSILFTFGCGEKKEAEPAAASETETTEEVQKLNVSLQPSYDAWAAYDAKKNGLDKANGLDINMVFFDSGMPQIEALPAGAWDIGATGTVPTLFAALRYGAYVVALADDESWVNTVMVRPDSPLLKTKGFNPKYPDVYGSPEDLKGKDILVTTVSGGHYVLSSYLNVMGLKDSDVNILNMEQAQMVSAFESGKGDVAALWAPFMYTGAQKGWKELCAGAQIGAKNPMLIVVPKEFGDKNPELVAKYLKLFLGNAKELKNNEANLTAEYQAYNKDWGGVDLNADFANTDMAKHFVFTVDEQIKMFDKTSGQSEVETTLAGIINFFADQGKFTPEEKEKLLKFDYVTDKFLKMAAEQE